MPQLKNARHERFARLIAIKGATNRDAYVKAGYTAHDPSATRLRKNAKVAARIEELIAKQGEELVDSTVIDRTWVLDMMMQNALAAMQEGKRTSATRALELIGREVAQMFTERKELLVQGEVEDLLAAMSNRLPPEVYAQVVQGLRAEMGLEEVAGEGEREGNTGLQH